VSRLRTVLVGALLLAAVFAVIRGPLHRSTFALPVSNDDAILLLMARHVLRGELGTILWNQPYNGALDAYLLALDRPFPGPVNFGTGSSHSVNTLLETVAGLVGIEKDCIHGSPRAGEVQELLCDNRMARSLGWTPKVGFEEGLRRYVHSAKAQETDSA